MGGTNNIQCPRPLWECLRMKRGADALRHMKNVLAKDLPMSPNAPRPGAEEFYPSSLVEKNSKAKILSYFGKLESFSNF